MVHIPFWDYGRIWYMASISGFIGPFRLQQDSASKGVPANFVARCSLSCEMSGSYGPLLYSMWLEIAP